MRAEVALYRNSARFFALFLLGLLVAFWPSYFSRLFEQPSVLFHLHGVALTLWVAMLVAQAQLIRTGRRSLHRRIGKASYVLAPAVVAITVSFVHYRVAGSLPSLERLPPFVAYFLALTLNSLLVFALFYALAIYHRRDAGRHARWMIATVFPLFTPITDRLIGAYWPSLATLAPRIDHSPILPVFGFAFADLILLGLAVWDWRANRRADVFAPALGALTLYHVSALTLYRVPAWSAFCGWFLGLPLS
jgi:FtsH-binding integral membrane protein